MLGLMAKSGVWYAGFAVTIALAGAVVAPAVWLMTREPMGPDVTVAVRAGVQLAGDRPDVQLAEGQLGHVEPASG